MKKKITESQLRSIVEQKINEAWYNNIDDFYHGVVHIGLIKDWKAKNDMNNT